MPQNPVTLDFSKAIPLGAPVDAPMNPQASALQSAVGYGATQDPDQYAHLLDLQKRTGIAPQLSGNNEEQVQQSADVNSIDYRKFAAANPRTTGWASNPDNAAVAGVNEVQRLASIEQNRAAMASATGYSVSAASPTWSDKALDLGQWMMAGTISRQQLRQNFWQGPATRGAADIGSGVAGLAGNVGAFFGWHGDGPSKQNLLQRIESNLDPANQGLYNNGASDQGNQFDWLMKNVAPMVPAVLATGGTSLLARTLGIGTTASKVLAGLTVGGMFDADQAGKTYTAVAGSGGSDYAARLAANRVAAINLLPNALFGATDVVPLLRDNPLLTSLGLGGATGASGQIGQNVVTGRPWYEGTAGAAAQGAAMQGGMHLGMDAFGGHMSEAVDAAEQSKLRERSPEKFAEAMQTIFAGDQSLRVPVEQFNAYFKGQGSDPATVATGLGSTNYAEAHLSGGDVEISPADFLSKLDPEHQKALLEHVVDPTTGLTSAQHREGLAELQEFATGGGVEKLMADTAATDAETASTPEYAKVKEKLRQRYTDAGETPEVAESLATKDANVFSNLARGAGMQPSELLDLYNPKVIAGDAPEPGFAVANKNRDSGTQVPEADRAEIPKVDTPEGLKPYDVARVPIDELHLDPKRFQYKMNVDSTGVTNLLKGRPWNDDLAGVVSVWRDPADGKTYVVNGHHRYQLAKETGQPDVAVRAIGAKDAADARAKGALQNIAEGRGTAMDAAKFFRDSGYKPADLDRLGISMGEKTATDGLALARLHPQLFDQVVRGQVPEGRAIAIGNATADPAEQEAILKLVTRAEDKGKHVTNETLNELARMVKGAGQHTKTEQTLFGFQEMTHSLALEKAEVSAYIRGRMAAEHKTFASVSDAGKAARLAGVEGQTINAAENKRIASYAGMARELYDRLSERVGSVDDILNRASRELAEGAKPNDVKAKAYADTRDALGTALKGAASQSDGLSGENAGGPEAGKPGSEHAAAGPDDNLTLFQAARRQKLLDWDGDGPVRDFPGREPGGHLSQTMQVPIGDIHPTEDSTDAEIVERLEHALKYDDGEPIPALTVERAFGSGFDVLDGHHRLEAAKRAGYKTAPVRVWTSPDDLADGVPKFTEDDLARMLKAKKKQAAADAKDASQTLMLFQSVFHGSPHRFDKFSTDHLGSGEGAQAYGHGLYFAGDKAVAEYYRKTLASGYKASDGSTVPHGGAFQMAFEEALETGVHPDQASAAASNVQKFVDAGRKAENYLKSYDVDPSVRGAYEAAIAAFKGMKRDKGQLYEANIPEDHAMLDWDKSLKDQPPAVRAALAEEIERVRNDDTHLGDLHNPDEAEASTTGRDLYRSLSERFAKPLPSAKEEGWTSFTGTLNDRPANDKAASEYLHSKGIDGIKYLDGSSRNAQVHLDGKPADTQHMNFADAAMTNMFANRKVGGLTDEKARAQTAVWAQTTKQITGKYTPAEIKDFVNRLSYNTPENGHHNYVVFDDKAIKILNTFYQGEAEQPRGWFRVLPDGTYEIGKTSIGDLSTFVHEPAHAYLKILGDMSKRAGASETLKSDYRKVLDFLGAKDGDVLTREQHETWARANERYLREGEAPSASMKGTFQRFGIWLHSIYKKATDLGVELTPEIRDVMDRLYASEQGVDKAESANGPKLFSKPEDAGWSEEQFKAYADQHNLSVDQAKSELLWKQNEAAVRERTEGWRDEEQNVRDAVIADVDQRPEYRAIRALRKGALDDGSPLTMNRDELIKQFGEERVKDLQKLHPGLYRNEGGENPEIAAEVFGYNSAEEMMRALQATPRRSAAIEKETRDFMVAKHGDVRHDGSLDDQARIALENNNRAEGLHSELKALKQRVEEMRAKASGQKDAMRAIEVAPIASYREAAHLMIEKKAPADLQPTRYLDASRKFSREAFDAARSGDAQKAADAKHKELMNHFLYREATEAKAYVGKFEEYVQRVQKPAAQSKLGLAGSDYQDQFNRILGRYGLGPRVPAGDRSLGEWASAEYEQGKEPVIDPAILDETRSVPYRSAPISEIRLVHDALINVRKLASLELEMEVNGKKLEFTKAMNDMDGRARDTLPTKPTRVLKRNATLGETITDYAQRGDALLMRTERLMEWLDGGKSGPWHDNLWNHAADAQGREYDLQAQVTQQLGDGLEKMPKEQRAKLLDKVSVPGIPETLTRHDLLSIAFNMGNDGNLDRLHKTFVAHGWDPTAINRIAEMLTPEEWQFVQHGWDSLKPLGRAQAELEKRMTGLPPFMVKSTPLHLHLDSGEKIHLDGGYYPIVMDPRYSRRGAEADAGTTAQNIMEAGYGRAATSRGNMQTRTGFGGALQIDFEQVLTQHTAKVIKDITHREFMLASNKMLLAPQMRLAMRETLGEGYEEKMMPWLRTIVNDRNGSTVQGLGDFSRMIRGLRSNLTLATLSYKISTSLLQFTHAPRMMLSTRPGSYAQAMIDFMAHPAEMTEQIKGLSPNEMASRGDTLDRDIREALRSEPGIKRSVARVGNVSIKYTDHILSFPLWLSVYRDALKEHVELPESRAQELAMHAADSAVRLGLGSGAPKDLPPIMRSNDLSKLLTMFYSFHNGIYGQVRDIGHQFSQSGGVRSPGAVGKLSYGLALSILAPALLGGIVSGNGPKDDENKGLWAAKRALLFAGETVPLLRDAASALDSDGEIKNPLLNMGNKLTKATMEAGADKDDKDWNGIGLGYLEVGGDLAGVPGTTQALKPLRYLNQVQKGNVENPNVWDAIAGGGKHTR